MLTTSTRPIAVVPGLELRFPDRACCNCGTTTSLTVISQDTRVTRYLLLGGTEITLRFPLPFCKACAKSSRRRPVGFLHAALVLAMAFMICFGVVIALGASADSIFVAEHVGSLSAVAAIVITASIYGLRRPSGSQTSYYQPVRIAKLRQEFVSGTIEGIRLVFTNRKYAAEFCRMNALPIGKKLIEVARA